MLIRNHDNGKFFIILNKNYVLLSAILVSNAKWWLEQEIRNGSKPSRLWTRKTTFPALGMTDFKNVLSKLQRFCTVISPYIHARKAKQRTENYKKANWGYIQKKKLELFLFALARAFKFCNKSHNKDVDLAGTK